MTKSKPEQPLAWTGERIIPAEGRYMFRRHLLAYQFALQFCQAKTVLDAGCGEGYGARLLAEAAATVIGADIAPEAVRHAAEKYARANLEYRVMDVTGLAFPDDSFDVVVSLQVIEHLHNADKFLEEIRRVLKENGRAIISTPLQIPGAGRPRGKYHVREYRPDEFQGLLDAHFEKVEYYGVRLKTKKDFERLRLLDLAPKLDIFGIRKLLPAFRRRIMTAIEQTIALDISRDNLNAALDIIGVCAGRRPTQEPANK